MSLGEGSGPEGLENRGVTAPTLDGVGHEHRLLSPEQVQLSLPIAGPGPRILAYGIDLIFISVLQLVLLFVLVMILGALDWSAEMAEQAREFGEVAEAVESGEARPEALQAFMLVFLAVVMIVQLVAEWLYFICSELVTSGQSIGKKVLRLRVVRSGGLPITLRASIARNLLRIVDILPSYYLVGLVAMVVSPETRRLGDVAADTLVVRMDQPPAAPPIRPLDADERGVFPFSREMIGLLGPSELQLARSTLRRAAELDDAHRGPALERAADAIAERIGYAAVPAHQKELFLRSIVSAAERG